MRRKLGLHASGTTYRHEACAICGHQPKKHARGIHLVLQFLRVTAAPDWKPDQNVEEKHNHQWREFRNLRIADYLCLNCAREVASLLDAGLDAA
jgi:hypothetical protein